MTRLELAQEILKRATAYTLRTTPLGPDANLYRSFMVGRWLFHVRLMSSDASEPAVHWSTAQHVNATRTALRYEMKRGDFGMGRETVYEFRIEEEEDLEDALDTLRREDILGALADV